MSDLSKLYDLYKDLNVEKNEMYISYLKSLSEKHREDFKKSISDKVKAINDTFDKK